MKNGDDVNYSVEHHKDTFTITTISKSMNQTEATVSNKDVKFLINALMKCKAKGKSTNIIESSFVVDKTKLMSYLAHIIPGVSHYLFIDTKNNNMIIDDEAEQAARLQGGKNRKYLFQYYYFPMKVLHYYDCIWDDRFSIMVRNKKLERFMLTKLKVNKNR